MYSRRVVLGGGAAAVSLLVAPSLKAQSAPLSYEIPLKLDDRRLLLEARINGQGPLSLVLDTGGQLSLIDERLVDRLKLRPAGSMRLGIAGVPTAYKLYQADEIIFGEQVRQPRPTFAATTHVNFRGENAGSLASGFLASIDSEIDFRALKLRLFPNGGPSRDGWHTHERTLRKAEVDGLSPYFLADATIGDVAFRPLLDTGAPSAIIAYPRLVTSLALYEGNWSPSFKRGELIDKVVRSNRPFRMGSLTVERPLVTLRTSDQFGVDALVGLPILQQIDMATDVRANRLYTRPNGMPPTPPYYNMSGLWIDRDGSAITAGAVGRGSPAEAAGIRVGDRLGGMEFRPMIDALNAAPGSRVAISVGKGSSQRAVELVLRDYL